MFITLLVIGILLLVGGVIGKLLGLAVKFVIALVIVGLAVGVISFFFRI